ncbi:HigA family addiction module antitoxin [Aliamphritea spongicola]|uniref:HigA family addiction module antitoxin n=1 Tax=Aliamphritea spongicola TaxID=707589 RepID=UPI00196B7C51|nr:HigA family addiction module antitoxin [Aliamphritea spongicola]MBN3563221.1 HigA family addiction module antidote protein [Aliamphritea spongicola]
MVTNKLRPIHPGEILKEEYLVPLGMSENALAIALHVPATRINDIVRGKRAVTSDTALRLARYFGGDAQSWMNLQIAYDLKLAETEAGEAIKQNVRSRVA